MTTTGSHFNFDSLRGAPLARNDFVLFGHFAILRQLHQAFILFPFLPCFSGKSREFVVENDTSYACGKKKPIFPENRCPFPKNHHKERVQMSSNNNKLNVPQAKQAMEQFKMQAASDVDGPVTY